MRNRKLETCFITAPLGFDTRPLRDMLSERGVVSRDASDISVGSYIQHSSEAAIADADFLCAVIPDGPADATVFYEIGVATGVGRPRLLFVAPNGELPVALRGESYARATLKDAEALEFHLDAFLKNAGKRGVRRVGERHEQTAPPSPKNVASALNQLAAWEARALPPSEEELVQFLSEVFEAAGYVASTGSSRIGSELVGADLAVWLDELQATVGNPLVIEVTKHPRLEPNKVRQLLHLLGELRSPLGLLVSWELPEMQRVQDAGRYPFVVSMGVRQLVEAIGRGDFARMVLTQRNSAVHSAA